MYLLDLVGVPIFEQLQIEEALLRNSDEGWCLINRGAPPAIVMGISGKADLLVHQDRVNCPLIQRFSGGGTVVTDENTLFVTVMGPCSLLDCPPFPEPLMRWMEGLLKPAFDHPLFALRENDFVIGERKCGGNAQYLRKGRFLHHATFLWDYCPERMGMLKMPTRTPSYRQERDHTDFVCSLKEHLPSLEGLIEKIGARFEERLGAQRRGRQKADELLSLPHRKSTRVLEFHTR
jgi:lipoate---protein ligase